MLCEIEILLKYTYLYVIYSAERRTINFGLAHLNWLSTLKPRRKYSLSSMHNLTNL